jgi:fluoride exporter
MIEKVLFVGLGGFAGAILRYLTDRAVTLKFPDTKFPVGIFFCNVLGCLLIGFFAGYFKDAAFDERYRMLIITGLLGSFTTFSTFSQQTFNLFAGQHFLQGSLNILLSVAVGLLFVYVGQSIAGKLF